MKTNLEELNYRFRKELLNNFGYRLYFDLADRVGGANLKSQFIYDSWVKGLFKKNGKETDGLMDGIDLYYNESVSIDESFWNEEYKRGVNFIDFINIPQLVYLWVSDIKFEFESKYKNGFVWFMSMTLVNSLNSEEYHKFHHSLYKKCSEEELNVRWMVIFMTNLKSEQYGTL